MDFDNLVTMNIKKNPKKIHSIVWIHGFGGSIASRPVIFDGTVYVGSDDYYFYAVNADTGKLVWKCKGSKGFSNGSAAILDSVLFIGNYDGRLYAIDKNTGKIKWRFKTGDKISASATLFADKVYFGSFDNYVYCIDADSGKEIWRFKTGDIIMSSPVAYDNILYIGSHDGNLYALNLDSGKEIWRFKTGGVIINTTDKGFPKVDDTLYFNSYDGFIYAVKAKTGKEIWRCKLSHGSTEAPFIHEGVLYATTNDPMHGSLHAIDIKSGQEIKKFIVEKECGKVSSFVFNNKIYFGISKGTFYAIDRNSFEEVWRFQTEGPVWCGGSLYGDMVIFGSWDCHLYALDGKTGKEIWRFVTSTKVQSPETVETETPIELAIERKEETDEKEEKYIERKTIEVFENFYRTKSEYMHKSEYASESDYK